MFARDIYLVKVCLGVQLGKVLCFSQSIEYFICSGDGAVGRLYQSIKTLIINDIS